VDQRPEQPVEVAQEAADARLEQDPVVEARPPGPVLLEHPPPDALTPVDGVDELLGDIADPLQARQRHLDELPLHLAQQPLELAGRALLGLPDRGGLGRRPPSEGRDGRDDLRLAPDVLPQHVPDARARVGLGVRPVELDHPPGELARSHRRGRQARAVGALQAEVHQGQQHGVLVGGGVATLLEELEDLLGERDDVRALAHVASQ